MSDSKPGAGTLTADAGDIVAALGTIAPIIERRNTIPILSAVLFDGQNITGTNLDIQMTVGFAAKKSTLSACVLLAPLLSLLSTLPKRAEVKIAFRSSKGSHVAVTFNGGKYTIPSFPVSDFLMMKSGDQERIGKANTSNFMVGGAMKLVSHAVSTEETRYYLNGIYLHSPVQSDEGAVAVATDGHRLSLCKIPGLNVPEGGVIVPRLTCQIVTGINAEPTSITFYDSMIEFEWPGMVVKSKTIYGSYPDYDRVIPKPDGTFNNLKLAPNELRGAIRRLSAVNSERSKSLSVKTDGDYIAIASSSPEVGSGVEVIRGSSAELATDATTFEAGYNAKYLLDLLRNAGSNTIELKSANCASPAVCNTGATIEVIMPLRGGRSVTDIVESDDLELVRDSAKEELEPADG